VKDSALDADDLKRRLSQRGVDWLVQALSLEGKREGRERWKVLCPWHSEREPSCSIRFNEGDEIAAHCFSCDAGGTGLDVISAVRGLRDLNAACIAAAELLGDPATAPTPARPRSGRPPAEEVQALWEVCRGACVEASDLQARGLDPAAIEGEDLARVLPELGPFPRWATCRKKSWAQSGHRWILPLYDARGAIASLHARQLGAGPPPKALSPVGCELRGLVLADGRGAELLRTGKAPAAGVIVCEGVPDLLTLGTLWGDAAEDAPAVLGVIAGSWSADLARRIPKGAVVTIWTHSDRGGAGQRYAQQILATLKGHQVRVVVQDIPPGAKKAPDGNDVLRQGGRAAVLAVLEGAAASVEDGWDGDLIRDSKGRLTKGLANVVTILGRDPRWRGILGYNEFARRIELRKEPPWHRDEAPKGGAKPGPWTDDDEVRIASWLERAYDLAISRASAGAGARIAAQQQGNYHPVRDYLQALRWDGRPRLHELFSRYFGAVGDHLPLVSLWWPISAVARILRPGCKVDHAVILEGAQGARKSSALETLAIDPAWYFGSQVELGDKDAYQLLRGKWIVAFEEIHSWRKAAQTALKGYITAAVDSYRPSYGRETIDVPRQCVFAGSTNEAQYLEDPTGGRRFWPVAVGAIDLPQLLADRDQLWAEAMHLFQGGHRWWPEAPAEHAVLAGEQEQRYEGDPWEPQISTWLREAPLLAQQGVAISNLLEKALGVRLEAQGRAQQMRVAAVLRRLGWRLMLQGQERRRVWLPGGTP